MGFPSTVHLRGKWVDAGKLEDCLTDLRTDLNAITFLVPAESSIMVDAAVRLLSLVNQLEDGLSSVRLVFEGDYNPAMGYLDRIGFFKHLSPRVAVEPEPPTNSGVDRHRGANIDLVEIHAIHRTGSSPDLPTRLSRSLAASYSLPSLARSLEFSTFTVFAELLDNIRVHSETTLPGFVALQSYRNGGRVKVVVSDSGIGLLETIRPSLPKELIKKTGGELIEQMFTRGLSRLKGDRGCGLKACAEQALRFTSALDVRLARDRFFLVRDRHSPKLTLSCHWPCLPRLAGTHICFNFQLDS